MYCYNCGAQIPEVTKFCPECGVRLTPSVDVTRDDFEEADYEDNNYEPREHKAIKTRRSSSRDKTKNKPKWRKWIIFFIVLLGILAVLFIPNTRGLYIYSTITYKTTEEFTKQEREVFEEQFQNKYMLHTDEEYIVIDPLNGLGFTDSDIKEVDEKLGTIEFSTSGNYAYIEITSSTSEDQIIVSFIKPTLKERIYFISKFYSWT